MPGKAHGYPPSVRKAAGTALANDATGAVVYTPPEGEARIRDLLANWERFLHEEETLDPLVRMAASRYLKALVSIGVLREQTFGKEKLFVHPKLMTLLTRDSNAFQPYR